MGLMDRFLRRNKKESIDEFKVLREKAMRGELSPEESVRFAEESNERINKHFEEERQTASQRYREMMRIDRDASKKMSQLENSPGARAERKMVNDQIDKVYLRAYGCKADDWNLLLEIDSLVSNAKESVDSKKLEQAKDLMAKFIKSNQDLLAPIQHQNYKEHGNDWNEAQKKIFELLTEIRVVSSQIDLNNRSNLNNQRLNDSGDAR